MGLDFSSGYRDDGGEEGKWEKKKEGKEIDYIRRVRGPARRQPRNRWRTKRRQFLACLIFFFFSFYITFSLFSFFSLFDGGFPLLIFGFFCFIYSFSYRLCGAHQLADKRPNARQPTNKPRLRTKNAQYVCMYCIAQQQNWRIYSAFRF